MKQRKNFTCLLLVAAILSSMVFTGCSSDRAPANSSAADSSVQSDQAERQSVNIMSLTFTGNPVPNDNLIIQELENYTNYDINFTWILDADYTDKISTMIAGGSLPEVVLLKNLDSNTIQNCRAGAFWDLTDYLKDYKNLSQINETVLNNSMIDGRVFGIPRTRVLMRHGITFRQDWLDNLGLDVPANLDEFRNVLKAFTFDDPDRNGKNDTYGLISTKVSTGFDTIALWFGAPNGWGEDETGILQPAFMTEEYFASMNWIKQLYDDGILNPDFATLVNSGAKEAFKAQQTGVFMSDADEANAFKRHFESQNMEVPMVVSAALETPAGKVAPPTDGFSGILAISKHAVKTEEDLRRCLTFLDKLNDEYPANIFSYGIEGTDYTKLEDGTVELVGTGITTIGEHDGHNQIMMNVVEENLYKVKPNNELAANVTAVQEENQKYMLINPGKVLLRTSETYNSTGAQLEQMIMDARIQYIVGELDEEGWTRTIESWKQQGGSAIIEEINGSHQLVKENE